MPPQMKLTAVTLDCADPEALGAFYRQATGLELHPKSNGDFAGLTREDGLFIGFQRVDDYQAPRWPGQPCRSKSTSTSRSMTSTRPRPCYWSWGQPSRSTNRAGTGGGSSLTRPGIPSA
jgi:hypothetical protein